MSVSFFTNQEVAGEDLNAISTVFDGESPGFTDGNTYTVEDLNRVTSAITAPGVSINGFAPSVNDGVLSVTGGIAFFADGYKFRLDSAVSMTLNISDGYIYLLKNKDLSVELLATEEEPPEGAMLLAHLVGSQIDDRRTYAAAKAPGIGGRCYQKLLPVYFDVDTNYVNTTDWQLRAEIHPAFTPKYLILGNIAIELPADGERAYDPTSLSSWSEEGYSLENGVVKIWYRNRSANSGPARTGYVELR